MLKQFRFIDIQLLIYPLLLWIVGCVVLWSLTFANPEPSISSLAIKQAIFGCLGFGAMALMAFIDYRSLRHFVWIIGVISLALLIYVDFFGSTRLGATRWIDLKVIQLQPSEVAKIAIILVIASLLAYWRGRIGGMRTVLLFSVLALPVAFVMKQPDLGTALILVITAVGMLVSTKLSRKQYMVLGLIAGIFLTVGALAFYKVPPFGSLLRDYQRNRIYTFLDPGSDPSGKGYNVQQAVIAVGNGGIYGRGLGKEVGQLSQLNFLPKAYTDFIFAALAEATGFIGAGFVIVLFGLLLWRILYTARLARDSFGALIAYGYFSAVIFSILVNVGMNLGIMPVTGIPLPFISSGGTALIMNFIGIGLLQSISMRHRAINFS